ncbi:MAG TPA: hypothetical protein VML54_15135 [Candidatus Limnocylindrales bacterium]|nr:hypothetical protein [Candidatus Limnocylindrales bacterium]
MKRTIYMLAAALVPVSAAAQEDPSQRLAEVLPPDVAAQVLDRIEAARAGELPAQAVANLAMEGVAKGRSGAEVLAAVEALVGDMGVAREALQAAGRPPVEGEVEAATAAMRMGVDGAAISELARSQASGRTLAVPLLVIGSLAERGLPSDEALAAVRDRLTAGASDAALLADVPGVAAAMGAAGPPAVVGLGMASSMAGFQAPVAGVSRPVGPQSGDGGVRPGTGRPDGIPAPPSGRGGGPGTG